MNITEFLKTRKFWMPVVAFVEMLLVHLLTAALKVELAPEIVTFIDGALWAIAGLVVWGDIGYDWRTVENPNPPGAQG